MTSDEFRIVRSETPVKEIWSRLGYFENEHNAKEFLKKKSKKLAEDKLVERAREVYYLHGGFINHAEDIYSSKTWQSKLLSMK